MNVFRTPLPTDVSLEAATRAHAGTSHTPERRGESEVASYVSAIQTFNDKLAEVADNDDRMAEAVPHQVTTAQREKQNERLGSMG